MRADQNARRGDAPQANARHSDRSWTLTAPTLLACLLMAAAASGCGHQAHAGSSTAQRRAAVAGDPSGTAGAGGVRYSPADADYDEDDAHPPRHAGFDDRPLLRLYGAPAAPADRRRITALVTSYYAASIAGKAGQACAALSSNVLAGLAAAGGGNNSSACATQMPKLLAEQHQRLVAEDPATMRVIAVYAKSDAAIALLRFRTAPESEIVLAREGTAWKVDALFGSYMT